jgi:general secretion pathway protein A
MLLAADGAPISVTSDVFERSWSGKAYVLWRDFEGLGTMLRQGGRGIAVVRLQNILHRVDAFADEPTGVFDDATAAAVLEFQRTHLLEQDGLVGPFTDIVLYAAAGNYTRPRLAPAVQAGS